MPIPDARVPHGECEARRQLALSEARDRGLDGLLIWARNGEPGSNGVDVYYYANHFSPYPGQPPAPPDMTGIEHAGLLVRPDGHSTLVVPNYASEGAQVDDIRRGRDLCGQLISVLAESNMARGKLGVIGCEIFPFSFAQALTDAFPDLSIVDADDIATRQRVKLSPWDVTMLRAAAKVGTRLVDAIVAAAQPGTTEGAAIGAGLTEAASTPGCMHWNFLVASGPDAKYFVRGQTPAWNPTYIYQAGDILHVDCYGYVYGYQYDLTRTVVVGAPPTEGQRRVIEASRALPGQMAALLTPGVTARSLWHAARDVVAESGFVADQIWFGHSIGFGWGPPYLDKPGARPDSDWELSPPCAFAFENFLDDQHGNCACWEDLFIWLPEGVEQITGGGGSDGFDASLPGPDRDAGMR